MGNSTRSLQSVADYTRAHPDIATLDPASGWSNLAIRIGDKVMTELLSQSYNWKFNRISPPISPFYLNQWQQDYATSLTGMGWLEDCGAVDINNTAFPPPKVPQLEVVKYLPVIGQYYYRKPAICWLPNDQLQYATWGGPATQTANPQANQVISALIGAASMPNNPWLQVRDPNGNLQVLTQFGTTGGVQPSWPAPGAAVGTQTTDGTCKWTVVDPKAQGFRLVPLPAQGGRVWQINPIGQAKPVKFASMGQFLDPIPDDLASYFEDGFLARCYEFSPDPNKQVTWQRRWSQWMQSIAEMLRSQDHERQSYGLYPDRNVAESDGIIYSNPGPAWPFGWWSR